MPVDPEIQECGGLYLGAKSPVGHDAMHGQPARIVVARDHMCAVDIGANEYRP